MKVAVTGGSGVVGRAVVSHLVDAGHEVTALSRSDASDARLSSLGARPVRGDILEPAGLEAAFRGVERVFHVAGMNEMCVSDPSPMIHANVDGALNVVRSAAAAGVRRVVHTSSAATIGEPRGVVATESTPHRGSYLSHYERSKHLAERVLFDLDTDVELVAVNPSSVQGPGRATGTGKLILDLVNGKLPVLVDTHLSIVDIDDCARGHLLAAEHGEDRSRYLLNSFTTSVAEAVILLEQSLERPIPVRLLPPWSVRPLAPVLDAVRALGLRRVPFCGEMVRTLAHGHRYDGSEATRTLGLEYTSAEQIISRLVAWFRSERLVAG